MEKIAKLRGRVNANLIGDPLQELKKTHHTYAKFCLRTVNEETVAKAIKRTKTKDSFGIDGVSSRIIKGASEVLKVPLTRLFNASIQRGSFPSTWKTAKVAPVLKGGDPLNKSNYRPVALLPAISKVMERVIYDQLIKHVSKQNILHESQHGFRPKRSTISALTYLTSKWLSLLQAGKNVGILVYDLSAAFDCLDAEILDQKLEFYNFDVNTRNWIKSYLTGRKQLVQIGMDKSEVCDLTVGSPQGAILSPLLFLIYISDIELWTKLFLTEYADDTGSYCSSKNMDEVLKTLEEESKNILKFMASNLLIANEAKTELLLLRKKGCKTDKARVLVGGAPIEEKKSIKLLGVYIDNRLNWEDHVEKVQKKINQRAFFLRRLRGVLEHDQLISVTNGLIYSVVRYGLAVYGRARLEETDPKKANLAALQRSLNGIMRIITQTPQPDKLSTEELLIQTGLPSLNQMTVESVLTEMWKADKYELPVRSLFEETPAGKRRTEKYKVPRLATNHKEWFVWKGSVIWNKFGRNLDGLCSSDVKKEIKDYAKVFLIV